MTSIYHREYMTSNPLRFHMIPWVAYGSFLLESVCTYLAVIVAPIVVGPLE